MPRFCFLFFFFCIEFSTLCILDKRQHLCKYLFLKHLIIAFVKSFIMLKLNNVLFECSSYLFYSLLCYSSQMPRLIKIWRTRLSIARPSPKLLQYSPIKNSQKFIKQFTDTDTLSKKLSFYCWCFGLPNCANLPWRIFAASEFWGLSLFMSGFFVFVVVEINIPRKLFIFFFLPV